jgi:hypothetical protein
MKALLPAAALSLLGRARDDWGRNAASRLLIFAMIVLIARRKPRPCFQDVMELTEFDAMLIAPRAPAPAQGWLT